MTKTHRTHQTHGQTYKGRKKSRKRAQQCRIGRHHQRQQLHHCRRHNHRPRRSHQHQHQTPAMLPCWRWQWPTVTAPAPATRPAAIGRAMFRTPRPSCAATCTPTCASNCHQCSLDQCQPLHLYLYLQSPQPGWMCRSPGAWQTLHTWRTGGSARPANLPHVMASAALLVSNCTTPMPRPQDSRTDHQPSPCAGFFAVWCCCAMD